jgi:hypothetical protein
LAKSKARFAVVAAAALIIAAGATWYFASPPWTLHQMKAAADANDPNALNTYIDYPALRENLRAEIMGQLRAKTKKDKSGFGGLGRAIATAAIGPMIDGFVSPAAIRAALMAKRDQAHSALATQAALALHVPDDPLIVRRGLSKFLVATKQQPTSGLVFKRHGLWWKLSGVELPPNR